MATYNRVRTRNITPLSYVVSYDGLPISDKTYFVGYERNYDTIGDYGGKHTLLLYKWHKVPFTFSGENGRYTYANYYTRLSAGETSHLSMGELSPDQMAALAAARTNPSRPHVSVPLVVGELVQTPKLIAAAGLDLVKRRRPLSKGERAASDYLSWEFGWKPLLNDLSKLLDFGEAYESRSKEINNLQSNGGHKRRYDLKAEMKTEDLGLKTINSASSLIVKANASKTTTLRSWCTVEWLPSAEGFPTQDSAERRMMIRNIIAGSHTSQLASNYWNIIPWSWLADWLGNIGDVIQASNNSVGFILEPICVMTHFQTSVDYEITVIPTGVTASPTGDGHFRDSKKRYLGSSTLSASIPFLDGRQFAILGSLSVLKGGQQTF